MNTNGTNAHATELSFRTHFHNFNSADGSDIATIAPVSPAAADAVFDLFHETYNATNHDTKRWDKGPRVPGSSVPK